MNETKEPSTTIAVHEPHRRGRFHFVRVSVGLLILRSVWLGIQAHKQYAPLPAHSPAPSPVPSVPMKKQFMWEDLDLSSKVNCGYRKCFIPSISDNEVGYLIGKSIEVLEDMIKATEIALEIEREYGGAKHLYITDEYPFVVFMPEETRSRLNPKEFGFSPSVVVQQMKAANDPSLFFACSQINLPITKRQLPSFASAVVEKYELVDEFKRNIVKERKMLKMMLHDKPELGTDLQALISTKGELFFIDLGSHAAWNIRLKGRWSKNMKMPDPKECDETFDAIDEALNERVL